MMETTPSAHADVDSTLFSKMPVSSIASGLSDIITPSPPAVVANSDGFFHALGDHAQMALSIDNQPIMDQQGSFFSTQIPLRFNPSKQFMEGTTAEYGGKTSLVVTTVTHAGVGSEDIRRQAAHARGAGLCPVGPQRDRGWDSS